MVKLACQLTHCMKLHLHTVSLLAYQQACGKGRQTPRFPASVTRLGHLRLEGATLRARIGAWYNVLGFLCA